jgi:hypothetical protein
VALAATAVPARADTPPAPRAEIAAASQVDTVVDTVTVTAAATHSQCDGLTGDEARRLAQQASRDGSHRKAAECFRVAGDLVKADRSTMRASADSGAAATRKAAANVETAKAQARRLRAAFAGLR